MTLLRSTSFRFHNGAHFTNSRHRSFGIDVGSEQRCSRPGKKAGGSVASWGDAFLSPSSNLATKDDFQPTVPSMDVEGFTGSIKNVPVSPLDQYNTTLLDNVKPKDWQDPDPGQGK